MKAQSYGNVEHIVVDGASTDGTVELIKDSGIKKWISEPDGGMYDALNKGIEMATGDLIGILNSDDVFSEPHTLQQVAAAFEQDPELEAVYGDIRFVSPKNPARTIRYYSSKDFYPEKFALGYMPAHPSVYLKKSVYETHGLFQTDYTIAADYELLTRVIYKHRIQTQYLPLLMVDMLPGGLSNASIYSRYLLNKEIVRACRENGIRTNLLKVSMKYFRKIFEYLPGA